MTNQKPLPKRWLLSRPRSLTILCILLLTTSPLMTFAQGPKPLVALQQQSQPCADSDKSERCQLKRAVSAALDEIADLRDQLKKASEAIAEQEKAIQNAKDTLAKGAEERERYERAIKLADSAIDKQQKLIETYERAIGTLQKMVDMAMNRIDALEKKVDKANGRTATLGIILTAVGVLVGLRR